MNIVQHNDAAPSSKRPDRVETSGLDQKKRHGLTLMGGKKVGDDDGEKKEGARYIDNIMRNKAKRDVEKAIIQQKVIDKEIEKEGGARPEEFITSAYKAELEKRKQFEKELLEEEQRDLRARENATAGGSAAFFQQMLDTRGGEIKPAEPSPKLGPVAPTTSVDSNGAPKLGPEVPGSIGPVAPRSSSSSSSTDAASS